MSEQLYKSNSHTQLEQVPSGYVSKRQYNVAMQALELLEGEREQEDVQEQSQRQRRLLRMAVLTLMPPPPMPETSALQRLGR